MGGWSGFEELTLPGGRRRRRGPRGPWRESYEGAQLCQREVRLESGEGWLLVDAPCLFGVAGGTQKGDVLVEAVLPQVEADS